MGLPSESSSRFHSIPFQERGIECGDKTKNCAGHDIMESIGVALHLRQTDQTGEGAGESAPAVAAPLGPRGACRIRIGGQVEVCTKSKELSFHNELRDGGQELRRSEPITDRIVNWMHETCPPAPSRAEKKSVCTGR
ncbi:hypothetical protein AXG93_938s1000 [Marchantia polymorpha subsp. ruderalis]|uniref:Uncharacterized protein n=1 Tax=Marchantia polymorpha subsp. ruderalis TaxID=1480154 RepID=A0A176VRG8_MARPO|nr:hypothetical protein AXG93_938s1000 [Marchantia polymorpha subsp. ruderalis]